MKYLKKFESLGEKGIEYRLYDYIMEHNDINVDDVDDCFTVVDDAIPNSVKKEASIVIKRNGWSCFWLKIDNPNDIHIRRMVTLYKAVAASEFIGGISKSESLKNFISSNNKLSCTVTIHYNLDNKDYQHQKWRSVCQSEVDQFESLVRSRGYDFDFDGGHSMWASKEVDVNWGEVLGPDF